MVWRQGIALPNQRFPFAEKEGAKVVSKRYEQMRSLRFAVYLLRSGRMIFRGFRKGTDKKFLFLDLLPNLVKSSWNVSGYKEEPFPSLFPKRKDRPLKDRR